MKHYLLAFVVFLFTSFSIYNASASSVVALRDAYAYATLKGTTNSAAFVTIENKGDEPVVITNVASNIAKTVELHDHEKGANGELKMVRLDKLTIPAASAVTLKPGGLHVMLIGLHKMLKEGDTFPVTFVLEDGRRLLFDVTVQKRG